MFTTHTFVQMILRHFILIFMLSICVVDAIPAILAPVVAQLIMPIVKKRIITKFIHYRQDLIKEKNRGRVSVEDLALMEASMVNLVEPIEEDFIVVDQLSKYAYEKLTVFGQGNQSFKAKTNNFFSRINPLSNEEERGRKAINKITGLYIVINESETALVEKLLGTDPQLCVLAADDRFLNGMKNPCHEIGREAFIKIITRCSEINSVEKTMSEKKKFKKLEVSRQWNDHLKRIVPVLEKYKHFLSDEADKSAWINIKEKFYAVEQSM